MEDMFVTYTNWYIQFYLVDKFIHKIYLSIFNGGKICLKKYCVGIEEGGVCVCVLGRMVMVVVWGGD